MTHVHAPCALFPGTRSHPPVPLRARPLASLLFSCFLSCFLACFLAGPAGAVPVIAGYRDFNFGSTVTSTPTGEKPQSKLWWNDGIWWGCLWDPAINRYAIHRLDLAAQAWTSTGTPIDDRPGSKADALWDGVHLYVVSNLFSTSPGPTTPLSSGRLYRYAYDLASQTYALDAGFPVNVNGSKSETLVLDQDSTGQLWVTWVEAGKVKVNRSLGDDLTWGQTFDLPVQGASTTSDDISSIVAFGGNQIGIMWSNQADRKSYFAVHRDSSLDTVWEPREDALTDPGGGNVADDHVNLKLSCDGGGALYAVTKTSLTNAAAPLVFVLRRAADGTWSRHIFGTVANNHTRPIVCVDLENNMVHVFAMSNDTGKEVIYWKSASTTGLLVLASDNTSRYYLHNYLALRASIPAIAGFDPPSGPPGTEVSVTGTGFTGATSVDFNGAPATFSVQTDASLLAVVPPQATTGRIRVTNGAGTGESAEDFVVLPPPALLTLHPTDDAQVKSSSSNSNYGASTTLRVRYGAPAYRTYLKFNVTGLPGPVERARLRLFVTDASPDGGSVHLVSNDYAGNPVPWTESGLNWNNAPALAGPPLASAGRTALNTWAELEVTAAITGDGTYSFGIQSSSSNSAIYSSDEGANRPELVLELPGSIPVVSFFVPDRGPVGTDVMIHGARLAAATAVEFGGAPAAFVVEADTLVRATVPAEALTGRIRVTSPDGAGESPADFVVTVSEPPAIAGFDPPSGSPGTEVTVTGGAFNGTTAVEFNGAAAASFTIDSAAQIRAVVPAAATTGPIRVTTPAGTAESAEDFVVLPPPAALTLHPTDDAQVKSSNPTTNYGAMTTIRLRAGDPTYTSYLKFQVTGITGTVVAARLRLFVTDESDDGGSIYVASNDYRGTATPWVESGLTWSNAPAIGGAPLSSAGPAALGTWVELDVTPAISGNGTFSFGMTTGSTNSALFSSDEGGNRPELVIESGQLLAQAGAPSPAAAKRHEELSPVPRFALHPNIPNPFNPRTEIRFDVPIAGPARLTIYDLQGRAVRALVDRHLSAGSHRVVWDGRDGTGAALPSGTYFLELAAGGRRDSRKVALLR